MTPEQIHEDAMDKMRHGWSAADIAAVLSDEAAILSRDTGVYYCATCGKVLAAPNLSVGPGGVDVYCNRKCFAARDKR